MPSVTFLGAARTVTGSKHLLETNTGQILVDCGLFQGLRDLRLRDWMPLPLDLARLDAVVLTHAHIDHSGYLPRLVAGGFKGRIFCTPGTKDLCQLVLPDAGRLQEEDARQANRHGYSKHHPALPLFTEEDALRALAHLQPVGYDRPVPVNASAEATFRQAGHLLGSAFVEVRTADEHIVFGGDLGRYGRPVLPDPRPCESASVLLLESTYGDRQHPDANDADVLAGLIHGTCDQGGKLVVPAFAVGRVEEVLYWIKTLEEAHRIPTLPVYVDSPMAVGALQYYRDRVTELDEALQAVPRAVSLFCTSRFRTIETPEQSKALTASREPSIVISASGMATGGRVLHHLEAVLPDARNTVLFVGYQSPGTRGRALIEGARAVKIHGRIVPVNARIAKLNSLSAHADQSEILRWLGGFVSPPRTTFLVHGEIGPMRVLQAKIAERFGWHVHIPALGERAELGAP